MEGQSENWVTVCIVRIQAHLLKSKTQPGFTAIVVSIWIHRLKSPKANSAASCVQAAVMSCSCCRWEISFYCKRFSSGRVRDTGEVVHCSAVAARGMRAILTTFIQCMFLLKNWNSSIWINLKTENIFWACVAASGMENISQIEGRLHRLH